MVTLEEWEAYKEFVGFTEADIEALSWVEETSVFFVQEVINHLYTLLLKSPQTKDFLQDEETVTRLKLMQIKYFLQLFSGNYGETYLQSRIKVGEIHKKIGLPLPVYLATYSHYFMLIRPHIFEYIDDEDDAFKVLDALAKLITLDEMVSSLAYS